VIFPAKHYITAEERRESALKQIANDLNVRLNELRKVGKNLEAYRLEQRTNYDLEMIREIGYCKGIENYSRYFDGRRPGAIPYTLIDFFANNFLTVIDESHITIPQIRGMYNGDRARKEVLVDYGFRLPSALDNRPLRFDEFIRKTPQLLYSSATPGDWEFNQSGNAVVEQLIRPTGIIDPVIVIQPTKGQVKDLMLRIEEKVKKGQRVLITTLTKRMAEELSSFLMEKGIKAAYLHSDIETLERTDVLDNLRKGNYEVLVGINLLREGLDLPEVSLVAILDADKEGFLRSETSLIQTMGRAARHLDGEVVMYADNITGSMQRAVEEVDRRREIQKEYNLTHGITPVGISKPIRERLVELVLAEDGQEEKQEELDFSSLPPNEVKKEIKRLEEQMRYEAEILNFEKAAQIRDKIKYVRRFL
ncbi:UvrB/UvrC motif-containing protein, partial [candidate division WWE3 bacterium]|nr:UvrB/UvrC motif-containing protein [candidate division WWE3 bacterium]